MKNYTQYKELNEQLERLIDTIKMCNNVQAASLYNLIQSTMNQHFDEIMLSKEVLKFNKKEAIEQ